MRLVSTLLVLFGILGAVHCEEAELGTEENPYPEGHEPDDEEEEGGQEGEEGEEGGEGEEGEGEGGEPLEHYEDDGKHEQLTQKHLKDLHKKFDADGDGKVHLKEIMAFHVATSKVVKAKEIHGIFDEIESTKDGYLSLAEHLEEYETEMEADIKNDPAKRELMKQHEIDKFKAADSDGDDKLDKNELVAFMNPETHPEVFAIHVKHHFREADANGDGKISKDEWDKSVRREHEQHMDDKLDEAEEYKNLDENGDGHIDMKELEHWESGRFHVETAMKKLFHISDKDGDSHLTEHELLHRIDELDDHADLHSHLSEWAFHDEM